MADTHAPLATRAHTPPDALVTALERQGVAPGSYAFRPLDMLRGIIAKRMSDSARTAPHFALVMKVEVDALLALRERLNAESDVKISVNDLLIKASALALIACPGVNATFTDQGVITHSHADVAFAVAIDGGLITPIVRAAETLSPTEIATATRDLAVRARAKRLRPEEYSGGSFSVSNLGMFGVTSFGAIINQPQGAILSVGAAEKTLVPDVDGPRTASILAATLTCDHRLIDGAVGAQWLQAFKRIIEAPEALVA